MFNKLFLIVILSSSLWSNDYNLVFENRILVKNIKDKKIGIISNIGNIFTSYDDNPMHHTRFYQVIESWNNDFFIQNQLKQILIDKGFTNINIILNDIPSIITQDTVQFFSISKKEIKDDLIKLITNDKYDLIIYIEKLPERMFNRIKIEVNKKIINNTNIGLSRISSAFFENKEYLTATFNISVLSIDNIDRKNIFSYINSYPNHVELLSNTVWNDTSREASINIINSFEKRMKKLFLLNINEFVNMYIKEIK